MLGIGYVRVSSAEQVLEGPSLDAQREAIKSYAQRKGLELVAVEEDAGISGSKEDRPGLNAVREALAKEDATQVVVWRLDRLGRALWALNLIEAWARDGVGLHAVGEGDGALDASTASGKFVLGVKVVAARHERDLIAERTARALQHLKANGRAYSRPVYGVDRDGDDLIANHEEQEILRKMRRWRGRGWSYRRICKRLAQLGVPTKRGGTEWRPGTVQAILKNSSTSSQ